MDAEKIAELEELLARAERAKVRAEAGDVAGTVQLLKASSRILASVPDLLAIAKDAKAYVDAYARYVAAPVGASPAEAVARRHELARHFAAKHVGEPTQLVPDQSGE